MSECYIYVIGIEDGPVKVGISQSPNGRLDTLQTGSPVKLSILHYRKCRNRDHALHHERMFHEVYAENRMVGEWFNMSSDFAIEGVDTSFDIEEWHEREEREYYMAAVLNIWQMPDGPTA